MKDQPSSRWSLVVVGVVIGLVWGTLLALIVLSLTVVRSEVASRPAPAAAAPAYPVTKTVAGQEQAKSASGQPVTAVGGGATGTEVVISNQTFAPHTLIVATGTTITWHNKDNMAHTITSNDGWFDSGQLAAGVDWTWQATKPGTYAYHCDNHPDMEGVLIVQPGGAVAAPLFANKKVEQAYMDSCGGCHGPQRQGATGPALIPERLTQKDDFYFSTIKNGRPGTVMPPWGPAGMTDEEVWALVGDIKGASESRGCAVGSAADQGVPRSVGG